MNEAQYREALAKHDWFYEFSDDHGVWTAGRDQYRALKAAQPTIDPDRRIWNSLAPEAMRFPQRVEITVRLEVSA